MKNQDTQLKCTWTNGIIWAVITLVLGSVFRFALVYICLPAQKVLKIGGQEVTVNFTSEFYNLSMTLMLACVVIPVVAFLFMYFRYMKIASAHPADLHAVAVGRYGRPWIPAMIIQTVLTIAWAVIGAICIATGWTAGFGLTMNDRIDIEAFLVMVLIALVFDLLLFFVGKLKFKPDLVQKNS